MFQEFKYDAWMEMQLSTNNILGLRQRPHEKWLRIQSVHIVQAGFPRHRPAAEQPARQLLLKLARKL